MHILVVHRQPLVHAAIRQLASTMRPPPEVTSSGDAASARRALGAGARVDVAMVEVSVRLPSPFELVAALHDARPSMPILALGEPDDRPLASGALGAGACGFVPSTADYATLAAAVRLIPGDAVREPVQPHTVGRRPAWRGWGGDEPPHGNGAPLTNRQMEVLALIAQGKPNKLICRELQLSEGTVKVHVSAVLRALNVNNRTQAALAAGRLGIVASARAPA